MDPKPLPPLERLNELFFYDDCLRWRYGKTSGRGMRSARSPVIGFQQNGYLFTRTAFGKLSLHRVIWAICYQQDPFPLQIDHRNRNRLDNRIENLRLATPEQNRANYQAASSTGVKGVDYRDGKYRLKLKFHDSVYRASFDTLEEAREMSHKCLVFLGGEYACLD